MGCRHPSTGRQQSQGSAALRGEESVGPGPRAAWRAARSTPGVAAPGWTRTWLEQQLEQEVLPPGIGGGQGHREEPPARSGSLRRRPAEDNGARGWSPETRPPHLSPSSALRRTHPAPLSAAALQGGSRGGDCPGEEGAATGNFLQQRGALQSPVATPKPPPTAPITHSLRLSWQQGRGRSRRGHSPGCQLLGEVPREGLLFHSPLWTRWGSHYHPLQLRRSKPEILRKTPRPYHPTHSANLLFPR